MASVVTVKNIIPFKDAEVVSTAQYVSDNCKTIIDKFTATNVSAMDITVSVNIVPVGKIVLDSNRVVNSRIIAPRETYTFPALVGQVMESGSSVYIVASASGLTIGASGREITT